MVTLFPLSRIFCASFWRIILSVMLAACLIASLNAAEVDGQLDRAAVSAGEGALLTLRISGARAGQPVIPEVPNLIINPQGQSQQTQWINGQTTVSVTYQYVVGSNTPGDYQIPAIDVLVDGKKYQTQPLQLKVLDAAAAQPPAGMAPTRPGSQPAVVEEADTSAQRFGFLTVELADSERKYVYVGEIAPVRIRAWIPADARAQLRSGVKPEGKAFTLHHVSDSPQQTQEIKDGKTYLVVTWFGGMSATKAGKYPASLSVDASVAVRDPSAPQRRRRRMGGPFDDAFFDRVFDDMNAPMIQKDVTLKSDDQDIEVRPLPAAGRPNGFNGAVGNFKFDAWEMPAAWTTGEPQQITARLSGSGNFALMNAPELTPADAWKVYPTKGEFTPGDTASFSGNKMFQFSAVPRLGGAQDVALAFSYFDPASGAYKTLISPKKTIQVSGKNVVDAPAPLAPTTKAPDHKDGPQLVAQHLAISPRASLVPLVGRPIFGVLLAVAAGLCVLGKPLAWLRHRWGDPQRRARAAMERATRAALLTARQCADARDVAGFFAAGRLSLQERLGALWNQPAQAITLAEIHARMADDSPVARFFVEADRQTYSQASNRDIPKEWRALLDEAMSSLTQNSH